MREALEEARAYRDTTEGGPGSGPQKGGKKFSSSQIKKAYGILNDPRYKQGNYSGAVKTINKLAPGLADHPDVKNALKRANEELEEANRYSVALKGDAKKLFDLSWKAGSKSKAHGDKEWNAAVDDTVKNNDMTISDKDIAAVKKAIQYNEYDPSTNENLDLSATGDTTTSNASQEVEQVELEEAKFTPAQVSALQKAYGQVGPGGEKNAMRMDQLAKMMGKYSKDHLSQLANLDIPMVSKVAKELMKEEIMNEGSVTGLPKDRAIMYIIKTDKNTASRIKSFLADNGERYSMHIDDDDSGQITLDAYGKQDKDDAYDAAHAIAKKFNVKVRGTR